MLAGQVRSVSEIEASGVLTYALIASGLPEAVEIGRSLANWAEDKPWRGDRGWVALYRSCGLAALGRHEEALELLPQLNQVSRLAPMPVLRDSWSFKQYADEPVYLEVVAEQKRRRSRLRKKLPDTLREFGVKLWPKQGE